MDPTAPQNPFAQTAPDTSGVAQDIDAAFASLLPETAPPAAELAPAPEPTAELISEAEAATMADTPPPPPAPEAPVKNKGGRPRKAAAPQPAEPAPSPEPAAEPAPAAEPELITITVADVPRSHKTAIEADPTPGVSAQTLAEQEAGRQALASKAAASKPAE